MRAHRIFISVAILVGYGVTVQTMAFSQEYRGTMGQQVACTPDVWRLCSAQVPDVDRIVACLRRKTPQLSRGCRAVFEQSYNAPRPGDDQARPYDPDYDERPYYNRGYEPPPYRQYGPTPYEEKY